LSRTAIKAAGPRLPRASKKGEAMSFTEIGAAIGFLTGIFTVFDRMFFGRPIVSLVKSGIRTRDLQITNMSKGEIIVTSILIKPSRAHVASDESELAIVRAHSEEMFGALIEPGGTAAFPIILRDGRLLDDAAPRAPFLIVISWRKTISMWLPQVPTVAFSEPVPEICTGR
jgi:hypothetical protein